MQYWSEGLGWEVLEKEKNFSRFVGNLKWIYIKFKIASSWDVEISRAHV